MNLLPIPALDGGHVMFYCMKLSAKKPSDKFLENAQMLVSITYITVIICNETIQSNCREVKKTKKV
jgi:regulator of sigma E protease